MTGPLTHLTLKFLVGALAFASALLLTPRALVDSATGASDDSAEISVQLLERPEDCLWCSPPPTSERCDDNNAADGHWLHPDEAHPDECEDRARAALPGA
ncbi:hypothetical protein DV096_08325 [Bradymonadaceae bacterium TMQ3]|nr:hypothetical protein DV096_08325 [Bradymonadaceae bacterium TMQ3]